MFADALDFTKKWLQDTADYVTGGGMEGGATCTPNYAQLPLTIHNHAYLRLLKWDRDTESFPEVMYYQWLAAISPCSPRLVASLKLSRVEPGQYLDGRPPGKTRLLLEYVLGAILS